MKVVEETDEHEEKMLQEYIVKEWEETAMDAGMLIEQSFKAKEDKDDQ